MDQVSSIDTGSKDHDYIIGLFGGLNSVMVAMSAIELEIFDILAKPKGPLSVRTIATEKGYDEENTTRLLHTLVALDLVNRIKVNDGQDLFENTGSGRLLAHCEPDNLVGMAKRMHSRFLKAVQDQKLVEEVRKGTMKSSQYPAHVTVHKVSRKRSVSESASESPRKRTTSESKSTDSTSANKRNSTDMKKPDEKPVNDQQMPKKEDLYTRYVAFDNNLFPHLDAVVNAFDFSIHQTTVDLGGGSGVLSYKFCEKYPEMKCTIFEVAPVIELIKERFLPAKEHLNVALRAGDFMDEHKLPSADLYLLSQIIHDWRPDQVDFLLDKVFKAILPGGGILFLEQLMDDERCGPPTAAVRDLFIMANCGGGLRTVSGMRELLTKHKFSDVKIIRTQPTCMFDIVYARKQKSH